MGKAVEKQNSRAQLTAQFRMYVAAFGCPGMEIDFAPEKSLTYTNGEAIFLRCEATPAEHFVEIAVQCALLASGSLSSSVAMTLLGQPQRAQRYLSLEVARLCASAPMLLRHVVPGEWLRSPPWTHGIEESLAYSTRRDFSPSENVLFGVVKPMALLTLRDDFARGNARVEDLRAPPLAMQQDKDLDDEDEAKDAPKFFQKVASPLRMASNPFAKLFNSILGARRSASDQAPGSEIPSGSVRQSQRQGAQGRQAHYTLDIRSDSNQLPQLVAGWRYPEWHCDRNDYRQDWVHVHETPLAWVRDVADAQSSLAANQTLLHRLKKLSFGRARVQGQREGDDFDLNALIERAVTLRCARRGRDGAADQANVYSALRRMARDLGISIAVDLSGSSAETNAGGFVVAREQALVAAVLAEAFTQCGDRVALTGFHSRTRQLVRAVHIKHFGERWSHAQAESLMRLRPSGFSRLGAVLRHSANLLERESGMPRRLLVILSDGFAYDSDYQGRYAREDVRQALREIADSRLHVLWIALGEMDPAIAASLTAHGHQLLSANSAEQVLPALSRAVTAALTRRMPTRVRHGPVKKNTRRNSANRYA